jgi:gamma-glutamyltranspeptidase/glutathione hydrolase
MRRARPLALLVLATLAASASFSAPAQPAPPPEQPTAVNAAALPPQLQAAEATSQLGMVVTGSPEASWAGAQILAAGGNAIDAAVAAALALGAAEISASGLGGQSYILIRLADGRTLAIDGSAIVPLRADRDALRRLHDGYRTFGHKLVATPGSLAALSYALVRYGSKSFAEVSAPAIEIAEFGAPMSVSQSSFLNEYLHKIIVSDSLRLLLLKDGASLWEPKHPFCNPVLACTLKRIVAHGAASFYLGAIADEIEADMVANGGFLRKDDLARIRPIEREPLRGSYRGYELVAFPHPGGGGVAIEMLHILENYPPELLRGNTLARRTVVVEAGRIAQVDNMGVRHPLTILSQSLLDKGRTATRAGMIRFDRALREDEVNPNRVPSATERDTTHVSVADRYGNVVALTQSLGRVMGACVMTPGLGFPYNNLLEGFDLDHPQSPTYLLPLRAPRGAMAPTIVLKDGKPVLVLGSAGSDRIPTSIVNVIVNVVDRGMELKAAVERPRVLWGGGTEHQVYVERAGAVSADLAAALERFGYTDVYLQKFPARADDLAAFGGVNAIAIDRDGTLHGVGDPRRQGTPAGVCGLTAHNDVLAFEPVCPCAPSPAFVPVRSTAH